MGRKMWAKYWRYHRGSLRDSFANYLFYNPHGIGLNLVSFLAYCKENNSHLSPEELDEVAVIHHKSRKDIYGEYGHCIEVAAPREVWDTAWKNDYFRHFSSESW